MDEVPGNSKENIVESTRIDICFNRYTYQCIRSRLGEKVKVNLRLSKEDQFYLISMVETGWYRIHYEVSDQKVYLVQKKSIRWKWKQNETAA